MKIQIQGSQFFDREAVAFAVNQADNERSRETLVYMSPADFLRIALPGQDPGKQERADALFEQGIPYNSLLLLRADETGRAIGHEGRHRARSLLKARVRVVPVRFVSTNIRWGQPDQTFPRYLIGENGWEKIPFPDSIIFPRQEKKQNPEHKSSTNMAKYPKYPYYVVEKTTGLVWAGADYKEDAKDFQKDLPIPTADTTVLMAKSVLSRYGRIQWAKA